MRKMSFKGIFVKIGKKTANIFKKIIKGFVGKRFSFIAVALIFFLCFGAMVFNLVHYLEVESYDAISSEYNKRQDLLAERNIRGKIITQNDEVLAVSGMTANGAELREYPYGVMFAHVVGYDGYGRMGIEKMANMSLLQTNDSVFDKVSNDIEERKNVGDTVVTPLNVRMQEVAFKSLGAYKGAIIVSEVETGNILAMVSKPDFDPNLIAYQWEDLMEDEESSVLVNRVTQGVYPPGSTFKIMDALAFYRQYPDEVQSYSYQCNGAISYGERKITCYHQTVHGRVDLRKSFAKSCNSSFTNIGLMLDAGEFRETLEDLLFYSELPGGMICAESDVPIDALADESVIAQCSIGQGKSQMSPYHMNLITSAIANDGVLMTPKLITEIRSSSGKTVKKYEDEVYKRLMTKEEALFLQELMCGVVEDGTGHRLQEAEYTSAGKTGSAEFGNNPADSHAWFTGYAPAQDPKVCVTVIIEGAGTGGDYAVPVAKRLFDAYFQQYSAK